MNAQDLLAKAESLAAILAEENAALDTLQLQQAVATLPAKLEALAALVSSDPLTGTSIDTPLRSRLEASGQRLTTMIAENRRLLERAITVQARVVGAIASASRRELARQAHVYGTNGAPQPRPRAPAIAVFSRV